MRLKPLTKIVLIIVILQYPSMFQAAATTVSLGVWQTSGAADWRIIFPVNGASELHYPQKIRFTILSLSQAIPGSRSSLSLDAGVSQHSAPAYGSDSDWDYQQSTSLQHYGIFRTDGKAGFLQLGVSRELDQNSLFRWGYRYQYNHYDMTEGMYFIRNYATLSPPMLYPDLASYYDLSAQGPFLSLELQRKLTKPVSLVANISVVPVALVQGHGHWNLRDLDFHHSGWGQLWDLALGLRITPAKNTALSLGYRVHSLHLIAGGTEDTNPDISWSKASLTQKGFYLSGEYRF